MVVDRVIIQAVLFSGFGNEAQAGVWLPEGR